MPQYTPEKPAVIRLAEPLARKCTKVIVVCKNQTILTLDLVVLEILVSDEQEDYIAFRKEICREWDYLYDPVCLQLYRSHKPSNLPKLQETLMFAWRLYEESFVRYEITFQCSADFWCFLFHLTKPLPHN